jgi:rhodanese-related sulfurtransferase
MLGAQIVGKEGVDKRIDVLATAIRGGMTVYDLEELELAYAPPYSSAKDPVNIAGFVASNMLKGDVETIYWHELAGLDREENLFIDLRNKDELDTAGVIKDALHIPLNELRKRLPELDRDKNYVPFCAVGQRAYIGHRILVQNGFKSRNLSGGYRTYLGAKEKIMKESPETRLWLSE